MEKHALSDKELEHVIGGNTTVNLTVPSSGSAADLIRQFLEARPQLGNDADKLLAFADQMDREGKKKASFVFDSHNRLISVTIG